MGDGYCGDKSGNFYSIANVKLPIGSTAVDCDAWCSQNPPELVGFEYMPSLEICNCLFDGGAVPVPKPLYSPQALNYRDMPGTGPIPGVITTDFDYVCYRYSGVSTFLLCL